MRLACFPEAKPDGAECAVLYARPLSLAEWHVRRRHSCPLFLGMYPGVPPIETFLITET